MAVVTPPSAAAEIASPPDAAPVAVAPAVSRRRLLALLAVMALAVVLLAGALLWPRSATERAVAPTFTLEAVRSGQPPVTLPSGQAAVVNFFAAWCDPCRDELPMLVEVAGEASSTVAFVGVDVKDSRSRATDLLDATGVAFPAGYDPDGRVAGSFGVVGMPTTVFVAADGSVAGVVQGPLRADELRRRVRQLTRGSDLATPTAMRNAGATLAFQPISRKSP